MARAESFLEDRRERLAASAADVNGIAGVEIDPADPRRLFVRFVHPLPGAAGARPAAGAAPGPAEITIDGGDRVPVVGVVTAVASGNLLTVSCALAGDFSTYRLAIDPTLPGYDPVLREIRFAWHLDCDRGSDCAQVPSPAPAVTIEPRLDYLARDWESYRRMMLDRMAVTVPDWTDRTIADPGVALVEWAAALGDMLSYRLDHVGTEYALHSARLRASAAKHARLVGYRMHNGASARVLAQVELAVGVSNFTLPAAGVAFVTRARMQAERVIAPELAQRAQAEGAVVFEPLFATALTAAHHQIALHHWGDSEAVLAKGATGCILRDPERALALKAGDILVLVQARDPETGRAADADPDARQAVRLTADPVRLSDPLETLPPPGGGAPEPLQLWQLRWGAEDALGFDLAIGARATGGPMALALGNIVLADHGFTLPLGEDLPAPPDPTDPELPPAEGQPDELKTLAALDRPRRYLPALSRRDLSFADRPATLAPERSAAALSRTDPAGAQAQIFLTETASGAIWAPVPDLLGQPAEARVFVPEVEADGRTRLRFGRGHDGAASSMGRTPRPGEALVATYRIGHGRAGNIGIGALAHLAAEGAVRSNVAGVTNPLPGLGGVPRETIAEVRMRAPVSFHRQRRAVTLADYEALLTARPDVQRATARSRWIGSWQAIFLSVDRAGGLPVDAAFRAELVDYLEPYRMMGHDLAIDAPVFVPLTLVIEGCTAPGAFAETVAEALAERLGAGIGRDGRPGFFHPDAITFGAAIYLSQLYEAALAVPGVADVTITAFARGGSQSGLDTGVLRFGPREIPVLANDPNRPNEGRLKITMRGGR